MFNVGDKVVCIDNTDNEGIITLGKTYTIAYVNAGVTCCSIEEAPAYDWFVTRFQLESEIMNNTTPTELDPLVEIHQSEYSALIEEVNLLQELLAEANQKLARLESKEAKPVSEYTAEDWEQAKDEKWVFELNDGTEVFVKGIMDEFDDIDHPIELSLVTNNLHECTVTDRGYFLSHSPDHQRSIKRRIK